MSDATTTDLYEVTMALSYLRDGLTRPATFSLFVRDVPEDRGFLVAAGLEPALDHLSGFRVDAEDVEVFAAVLGRSPEDLEPLLGLGFTGDVRAVPEGRVALAGEPLLEVTAPLPQAQLVESYVLNQVNHQTTVASKCARCVLAADGHPVVDFSLRRAHGTEAARQAARLGAMVGFAGTSNVAAAHAEGLPAFGTMAHSYIEAFGTEEAAFRAFARAHPGPVTYLVDTYDTERGVATAARVLTDLGLGPGCAIRLDSGDLGALAVRSRHILDAAGLPEVRIVASGGLDEFAIDRLVRSGAPIDTYAVGTKVGVSADAPCLDSAYKLAEYDGRPVMKLSAAKVTFPGRKQVFRRPGYADVIALHDEPAPPDGEPLLETVMRGGRRTCAGTRRDRLQEAKRRFARDLADLPADARRITSPVPPRAVVSQQALDLAARVRRRIEREFLTDT
ncbi:nicotinate phosphoribosyltransferase [Streptomyces morookaense]|uniref:Nicotinate phosphoribosyltransferase n=1 Tax=Streptomyces morookaense TaxID=1970 RepID=A0A7Y7B2E3_STRMO|nr:nicotinate phosphoribosyltransferase [Streptomyces morookaense]NVK77734.1 nicotinate phosphoribosyltransferase [Streptomyces morookaense]GHF04884.1 nicotinate phosphoribosyltransferase [Streptomyces morookaense]